MKNNSAIIIKPIKQTNIPGVTNYERTERAWIAIDGQLGNKMQMGDATRYKLICFSRFCFEDKYLHKYEETGVGNFLPASLEEARFGALAYALSEFCPRVLSEDFNYNDLKYMKVGIVSAYPEFLYEIKKRLEADKEDDYYYSYYKNPIDYLRCFNKVSLLQIAGKDITIVQTGDNFKIQWN